MTKLSADLTIAGSAIVVLMALVSLARAIFRFAVTMRDNTRATVRLTEKLDRLTSSVDGRFEALVDRVSALESRSKP